MIKLIKLELTKNDYKKSIFAALIAAVCIIAMVGLIGSIPDETGNNFTTVSEVFLLGDILTRCIYIVFSGVLVAELIVAEFKNGTIKNIFVYPVSRKKVMTSKLLLIFSFTFVAYILTTIVFGLSMMLLNPITQMVPETLTLDLVLSRWPETLFGALMTSGIGLISLFAGMRKKSVVTTIVTAVILAVLLSSGYSSSKLYTITIVSISLCFTGIVIALLSFRNIDCIDIH